MHPLLVLIIVALGGAIVGLSQRARGGETAGGEQPILTRRGYVLIRLGAIAGLAAALGTDNPEWFI